MIHCLDPYALIGSKTAESAAAMMGALSSTPLAIARKRERAPTDVDEYRERGRVHPDWAAD